MGIVAKGAGRRFARRLCALCCLAVIAGVVLAAAVPPGPSSPASPASAPSATEQQQQPAGGGRLADVVASRLRERVREAGALGTELLAQGASAAAAAIGQLEASRIPSHEGTAAHAASSARAQLAGKAPPRLRVCGSPAVDGYAHVNASCLEASPTAAGHSAQEVLECYTEEGADYDGLAVRWGIGNTMQTAAEW